MQKIRQIDYKTPRVLVSYSKKCHVLLLGKESRYQFSGKMVKGKALNLQKLEMFAMIGKNPHFPYLGAILIKLFGPIKD